MRVTGILGGTGRVRTATTGRPAGSGLRGRGTAAGPGALMTARFGPRSPSRFGRLRVPSHRASSATLSGAYPFLAPEPCRLGALVGSDALTGEPFSFDP